MATQERYAGERELPFCVLSLTHWLAAFRTDCSFLNCRDSSRGSLSSSGAELDFSAILSQLADSSLRTLVELREPTQIERRQQLICESGSKQLGTSCSIPVGSSSRAVELELGLCDQNSWRRTAPETTHQPIACSEKQNERGKGSGEQRSLHRKEESTREVVKESKIMQWALIVLLSILRTNTTNTTSTIFFRTT